jgi:hypothetical protein
MANTNLSELYPWVSTQLPRATTAVVQQALVNAAREFLRQTHAWREALDTLATIADEDEYDLSDGHDYDATILHITKVELEDSQLGNDEYSFAANQILTLTNTPDTADLDLDVSVVFLPDLNTSALPDWLVTRWGEAFACGALMLLKSVPNSERVPNPWFDRAGAQVAAARFHAYIAEAKAELAHQFQDDTGAVSYPFFA